MSDKKKSDLVPRLLTAVVAVPLLLALMFLAPNWGLWALISVAAAIGCHEYLTMTLNRDLGAAGWFVVTTTFATLTVGYWLVEPELLYAMVALGVIGPMVMTLSRGADMAAVAGRLGALLSGYVYATVLFGGLLILVADQPRTALGPHQGGWFLFALATIWAGDTAAYFAGRAFGKRKLAPRISPGKTWAGAIGGAFGSLVGAAIVKVVALPVMEWHHVVIFALPGAILGQVGDLAESLIKRSTGFKDSGSIIYGHGGMLDRVDALIFAAPWFAVLKLAFEL